MAGSDDSLTPPQNRSSDDEPSQSIDEPSTGIQDTDSTSPIAVEATQNEKNSSEQPGEDRSVQTNELTDIPVGKKELGHWVAKPEDEMLARVMINKARKAVKDGTTMSAFSADEVADLTRMVAQLTDLLAAKGFGREKVNRTLAYMNGPSKLSTKSALKRTGLDWARKRRTASGMQSEVTKSGQDKARDATPDTNDHNPPGDAENSPSVKEVTDTTAEVAATATDKVEKASGSAAVGPNTSDKSEKRGTFKKNKGKQFFKRNWSFKAKDRGNTNKAPGDKTNTAAANNADNDTKETDAEIATSSSTVAAALAA